MHCCQLHCILGHLLLVSGGAVYLLRYLGLRAVYSHPCLSQLSLISGSKSADDTVLRCADTMFSPTIRGAILCDGGGARLPAPLCSQQEAAYKCVCRGRPLSASHDDYITLAIFSSYQCYGHVCIRELLYMQFPCT